MHLPRSARAALLLSAVALVACASRSHPPGGPDPSPELTPEQVVRIQVRALQHNDDPTPDAGIETAFRFASPSNREMTGPLDRFAQMVHLGYPDLIGFERADYGPIRADESRAVQPVTFVQPDGRRVTYLFGLSRQSGGACDGCWMTDGVVEQPDPPADGLRRI